MGYGLGNVTLGAVRKPKATKAKAPAAPKPTYTQALARQKVRASRGRAADTAVQQAAVKAAAARAKPTAANKAAAQRAATTATSALIQAENAGVKLKPTVVKAAVSVAKTAKLKLPANVKKKMVSAAARSGIVKATGALASIVPGGSLIAGALSTGALKKLKIKNPFAKRKGKPQIGVPGDFPVTEADPNGDGITTSGQITPAAGAEVAAGAALPPAPGSSAAALPLPAGGPGDVGGGGGGSLLYPGTGNEGFATPTLRPPMVSRPDVDEGSPLPGAQGGFVTASGATMTRSDDFGADTAGSPRFSRTAGGDVAPGANGGLSLTSPAVLIGAGAGILLLVGMLGGRRGR